MVDGKFDPEAFIVTLRERVATDEEVSECAAWAASFGDRDFGSEQEKKEHPLVRFIFEYTAKTRVTPQFSANFKKVNAAVMPHIVRLLGAQKA